MRTMNRARADRVDRADTVTGYTVPSRPIEACRNAARRRVDSAACHRICPTVICLLLAAALNAAEPKPKLWSLQPVVRPEIPAAATQSSNPIDAFIAARQKKLGLHANAPADKLTLLRRVYFDLVGLPPMPAEQDAFLADQTPGAYERVVDRLLENEQHGVRWARHWLDV